VIIAIITFWLSVGCVLYTYALYPALLVILARLCNRPVRRSEKLRSAVSIIVAAHNEEAFIGRRVHELARILVTQPNGGELLVVSDGSSDRTAETARSAAAEVQREIGLRVSIRVVERPVNQGKAIALNEGVAAASSPLLVFADARQTWAPDAIDRLVENFADPAVGAVSGDLVVESAPGVMAGVGFYWRFEKWLRQAESRYHSMVSVTGCISAVRRSLLVPIPPGTVLDDVYWPLMIAMEGHRVVHEARAKAFDHFPLRTRDEFRRKVRTLAGNFQLMALLPSALLPWRNRAWWQFVSHRVLRLAVPWGLLAMLIATAVLGGPFYRTVFLAQTAFYLLGLAGIWRPVATRSRLASTAASFLVLNSAAWVGFWVWAFGKSPRSWSKVKYQGSGRQLVAEAATRAAEIPQPGNLRT